MLDFLKELPFPIIISVGAIIAAIILGIRGMLQEKRFRFIRQEDTKKIESLAKEREDLKKEVIAKLDMLSKSSDSEMNTLLEILKKREERQETEREDLTNWLEYRMTKLGDELENRIRERLNRIQHQIDDTNTRITKIEKPNGN